MTYISTPFVVVIVRVNVSCISSFDSKTTLVFKLSVCPVILLLSGRHLSPSRIHLLVAGSSLSDYVVHVAEFQWIWWLVYKWCSAMALLTTILFSSPSFAFSQSCTKVSTSLIKTNVQRTSWLGNYLFTICPWVTKASGRSKSYAPLSKRLYFFPSWFAN